MATRLVWTQRVAQWRASSETAAEFCAPRGWSASTLLWWSSRLKSLGPAAPTAAARGARFKRVVVEDTEGITRSAPNGGGALMVDFAGARVEVPSGADPATVRAVFGALRTAGQRGGRR